MKHRDYDGQSTPDLSCKTCCTRYVEMVKANVKAAKEEKAPIAKAAAGRKSAMGPSINPMFI
jgi:hypothetical protein